MLCVSPSHTLLTHWGWVTHICFSKLTSIGSDNALLPDWHQAVIWTNAGILLIGPLGTNFSVILIEIHTFSFKKMHLKMSSGKWRPFWSGLKVLISCLLNTHAATQGTKDPTVNGANSMDQLAGLTWWGFNKMAVILQTTFSNEFSWMKSFAFLSKCPIDNKWALVEVMACCGTNLFNSLWPSNTIWCH